MKFRTLLTALAATTATSHAAITLTGDSSSFAYQYEMDVVPSTQDLDSAGAATDWFAGTAGGVTIPTVSGGVAQSSQSAATPQVLFRTDIGGSIQRQSTPADFTIEIGLRVIGPMDAGDVGIFGIALDPVGGSNSIRLNVGANDVSLDGDGNNSIATASNSDTFHAFRVAYESSTDVYTAWRDGVQLYSAIAGTNGSFNASGAFFLGDFTGTISGEWEVDYIRLDPNAVAPIPEPATGAMLGLTGLALALRRRR